MNDDIDVLKLLHEGTKTKVTKEDLDDNKKAGSLRGGSGGWMSDDFKYVTGSCPRKVWARYKGYTLEDNIDKAQMFEAGHLSEDAVCSILDYSWPHYKRETEVPTSWTTDNGILVTGRPDIVLCDPLQTDLLTHGLELKLVSSLWTALEVLQTPKVEHIIQSAHYSKQLNVPYTIVYVNRTNWSLLSDFALQKAPKEGEPGSEVLEYKSYKTKTKEGKEISYRAPKTMKCFYRTFPMRWDELGQVEINNGQEWLTTFVTWEGIQKFYNYIATMNERGHCGPCPTPVTIKGDNKSYKLCSKEYCNMYQHCKGKANLPLDKWKEICDKVHADVTASRINP